MTRSWREFWRELRRDRRGVAALEAGLVITFLLSPLLAGVVGVGQAMLTQYRVDRGTHAALFFAWGTPLTATVANVQQAARDGYGTDYGPAYTVTASFSYYCIFPTESRTNSNTQPSTSGGTCIGGRVNATWVTVNGSAGFTPILRVTAWTGATWSMAASSTVRIQ